MNIIKQAFQRRNKKDRIKSTALQHLYWKGYHETAQKLKTFFALKPKNSSSYVEWDNLDLEICRSSWYNGYFTDQERQGRSGSWGNCAEWPRTTVPHHVGLWYDPTIVQDPGLPLIIEYQPSAIPPPFSLLNGNLQNRHSKKHQNLFFASLGNKGKEFLDTQKHEFENLNTKTFAGVL